MCSPDSALFFLQISKKEKREKKSQKLHSFQSIVVTEPVARIPFFYVLVRNKKFFLFVLGYYLKLLCVFNSQHCTGSCSTKWPQNRLFVMPVPWVTHKAGYKLPHGRCLVYQHFLHCWQYCRPPWCTGALRRKCRAQSFPRTEAMALLSQVNYNYERLIQTAAARKSKVKVKKKTQTNRVVIRV